MTSKAQGYSFKGTTTGECDMVCETKYKSKCPRCSEYVDLVFQYRVNGVTSPATSEMVFNKCNCSSNEWDEYEKTYLENTSVEVSSGTLIENDEVDELMWG